MNKNRQDIMLAIAVMIFGLIILFFLIPTQVEMAEEYDVKSLSPAFFPELAAGLLVFLSVLLLFSQLLNRKRLAPIEPEQSGCDTEEAFTRSDEIRVWLCFVISVAYYYGFKCIGFIPATILVLSGLFWVQGVRPARRLLIMSVVTTLLVYAFFRYVMKVYFPEALFWR
jgi:hypothetical protein